VSESTATEPVSPAPPIRWSLEHAAEVVARHADDRQRASRLGLRLSRVSGATQLDFQRYAPSLAAVLAGRKRSILGEDDEVWGSERFLVTPVDLPVVAGVVETGSNGTFLAATWEFDLVLLREVALAVAHRARPLSAPPERLGRWTPSLADAFARLVSLLDDPETIPILGPGTAREVILRLLQTEQAPRILLALSGERSSLVIDAVALLTDRMCDPWTMPTLAAAVHTSESTLFGRFKHATSMSPMQYLKRLRLGEARHRMVILGESAAQAAQAVGYHSASHFSRDYRAIYGSPPAADAARSRTRLHL
jgi:AraC-like DNA-binding protein